MQLLSVVHNFGPIHNELSGALYRAFVRGLEPEEACLLLDLNFPNEKHLRRTQARKIASDMRAHHLPCHNALLARIGERFPQYTYQQCQRAGDFLAAVYDVADPAVKERIALLLLESRYGGIRKYAYNKLYDNWSTVHEINLKSRINRQPGAHIANWNPALAPRIEALWREHGDPECAKVIVAHFPEIFLVEHFEPLQCSMEWPHLQRLYERAFPLEPRARASAMAHDPITAVWVLADMGVALDDEEALALLSQWRTSEKSGLLIACFGRMGLWNVLMEIYRRNLDDQYE